MAIGFYDVSKNNFCFTFPINEVFYEALSAVMSVFFCWEFMQADL